MVLWCSGNYIYDEKLDDRIVVHRGDIMETTLNDISRMCVCILIKKKKKTTFHECST